LKNNLSEVCSKEELYSAGLLGASALACSIWNGSGNGDFYITVNEEAQRHKVIFTNEP